jgi:hypothetical protein
MWESRSDFQALREGPKGLSTECHFHSPSPAEISALGVSRRSGFDLGKEAAFDGLHVLDRLGVAHDFANTFERRQGEQPRCSYIE